ncbi:hypothetical protein FKP32DRAFT_1236714 [Trametes sanguinea]|nr:hypothetical protein FKP32DRAFT_1236714 [Trametes sanguinea]
MGVIGFLNDSDRSHALVALSISIFTTPRRPRATRETVQSGGRKTQGVTPSEPSQPQTKIQPRALSSSSNRIVCYTPLYIVYAAANAASRHEPDYLRDPSSGKSERTSSPRVPSRPPDRIVELRPSSHTHLRRPLPRPPSASYVSNHNAVSYGPTVCRTDQRPAATYSTIAKVSSGSDGSQRIREDVQMTSEPCTKYTCGPSE